MTAYGSVMTAGYRGDGLRAWKQTSAGKTYYLYDGDTLVLEENSSGTKTAVNTFGPSGLLARTTSTRTLLYLPDPAGNVAQQVDASSGAVVASYSFTAWGNRSVSSNDSEATSEPYTGFGGIHGYFTDWETGLQLLGHRYYDPALGRFLTRDPASYGGGINLYEYCGNSPIGSSDTSGLFGWPVPGLPRGSLECISTLVKLAIQTLSGTAPCLDQQVCQFAANCLVDLGIDLACKLLIGGLTCLNFILANCLCGAIEGMLHYFVDLACAKAFPCGGGRHFDWRCLLLNSLLGLISGCYGGLLDFSEVIQTLGGMLLALGISSGLDASADQGCQNLHWD